EAAPRHVGHELVAVAEVPVGRRRTDPGPARRLRKGEAGGPLLRDQFQRRVDQGFFQVAVVVAARARPSALPGPAHVKSVYMTRGGPSISAHGPTLAPVNDRCAPARLAWRCAAPWGSAAPGRRRRRPPAHAPRPKARL